MRRKNKLPITVRLMVLSVITAVIWIGYGVFRAATKKPAPSVDMSVLEPLSPTLDTKALGELGKRIYIEGE